jgi:hypothetical protein
MEYKLMKYRVKSQRGTLLRTFNLLNCFRMELHVSVKCNTNENPIPEGKHCAGLSTF